MNNSYDVFPILERLPLEIESLTAYDGNLVVGTRQGHLLMYSVGRSGADVQLLRSNKNFSRKAIAQVAVVPHHQILISLADNIISIHDLTVYNFPLLSTMNNTKGASVFDLEIKRHTSLTGETAVTVRLAVAVRRKIQLYYWKARQFQSLQEDISLPDPPTQLLWCGGAAVIDQTAGYRRLQLSGELSSLVETARGCTARMVCAGSDSVALQTAASSITVMDATGEMATMPTTLAFSQPPTAIVWQEPYVLGVVQGRSVEVVSGELAIQSLPLNKPRLLATDTRLQSNAVDTDGSACRVFCASLSHVWCLRGVQTATQLPSLLASHHYSLALRLLDAWGGDGSSREHIHKLHAFHLFCNSQFQLALDTFLQINTELVFVIGLFPTLVPADCQRRLQYPSAPPVLAPPLLHEATTCLIDYLLKKRQQLVSGLETGSNSSSSPNKTKSKRRSALHHQLQVVDTTLLKCYLQERPGLVGPLLRLPDGRVSLAEGERLLREHDRLPDFLQLLRARGLHQRALSLLQQHQHTPQQSQLAGPRHIVEYMHTMGAEHLSLVLSNSVWLVRHHPLEALRVYTGTGAAITDAEMLPRYSVLEFLKEHQPRLAIPYLEHLVHEWGDVTAPFHNELIKVYRDFIVQETSELQQASSEACPDIARAPSIEGTDTDAVVQTVSDTNSTDTTPPTVPAITETSHPDLAFDIGVVEEKLVEFVRTSTHYTPATVLLCLANHPRLLPGRAVVLGVLGQHRQALQVYITALHDLPAALKYCHTHYTPQSSGPASQVYLVLLELLIQCDDVASLIAVRPKSNSTTSPACDKPVIEPCGTPVNSTESSCVTEPRQRRGLRSSSPVSSGDRTSPLLASLGCSEIISDIGPDEMSLLSQPSSPTRPNSVSAQDNAKFDMLLNLLHTYSSHIRLKPAVQLLPDSLRVCELRLFLQSWTRQFAADRRRHLLQRGVARATTAQVKTDLSTAQHSKLLLSSERSCSICKKRLTRFSAFVVLTGGRVCHFSCREQLHSTWLKEISSATQRQAVDARTRAAVSSSPRL